MSPSCTELLIHCYISVLSDRPKTKDELVDVLDDFFDGRAYHKDDRRSIITNIVLRDLKIDLDDIDYTDPLHAANVLEIIYTCILSFGIFW